MSWRWWLWWVKLKIIGAQEGLERQQRGHGDGGEVEDFDDHEGSDEGDEDHERNIAGSHNDGDYEHEHDGEGEGLPTGAINVSGGEDESVKSVIV